MSPDGAGLRARAWTRFALALALCAPLAAQRADGVEIPAQGSLRVERSTRVAPGSWTRAPVSDDGHAAGTAGVIVVEGVRNATLDLRGVTLRGASEGTARNALAGYGIVLRDCENVTVRGGKLGGYRGCIVAERCTGLRIEGVQFDGYFSQRLASTQVAEDPADRLEPRDDDAGEWLARYGAAISLSDCTDAVVVGCRARHGQNGALLTRCRRAQVYDNDFSFLSGWGVALFRSSDNVVANNRLDYCVRGFGDGRAWRGQGAAALIVFERSCDNVIAGNSGTHCGRGLWLFAGRDAVEGRAAARGEQAAGGSDRNAILQNDFSFCFDGGIEATYSGENEALDNAVVGCREFGISAGYSRGTTIGGNDFSNTRGRGISIEHGQECRLVRNVLHGCEVGLELRWDDDSLQQGGAFGAKHDTTSRDHWIAGNSFNGNDADVSIQRTSGLCFQDNVFTPDAGDLHVVSLVLAPGEKSALEPAALLASATGLMPSGHIAHSSVRPAPDEMPVEPDAAAEPELPGSSTPIDPSRKRGLDTIVVGEWGPWDFESGEPRPAPPAAVGALAGAKWSARWFSWARGPDPRGGAGDLAAWRALADEPLVVAEVGAWTSPWAEREDLKKATGAEKIGLIARTQIDLPAGTYVARVVSDDGVRLSIDGKPALENWSWHAAKLDEARVVLEAGSHVFELEWFQIDGAAALEVALQRVD